MSRIDPRFGWLAGILVTINLVGLMVIYRAATFRGPEGVRVLSALPDRDVDEADRFSLIFDEPLVAASAVGQSPERALFRIEPTPDGRWVWSATDRLEYRLARPLPPGRVFSIRPAADFTAITGRRVVGDREFRFETRPLRILETAIKSADQEKIAVLIRFNQPVSPTDLLHHLKVRDENGVTDLEPICLTCEAAEDLIIHVRRPNTERLRLTVKKDLKGHGADLPLGADFRRVLQPTRQFCLERASVAEYSAFDREIDVRLDFSRQLRSGQALAALSITPSVAGARHEFRSDELVITAAFSPGSRYQITVGAGLLSEEGEALAADASAAVDIRDRWPGLRFCFQRGFLHPSGNLLLELEVTNVAGVALEAREILPVNLVHALQGHQIDATARILAGQTVPLDLRRNEIRKLAVDLRKLLGVPRGFYQISAADVNQNWRSTEATVCVSDLAMTAKAGREGWVVWVTRLSTAEPVSGCRVRAFSYNNQELAAAVTDADGLARLAAPANHAEGPAWVLTAEDEQDRTFLIPDEQAWVLDDIDQSGRNTPETYDAMLYAERGVYRPGDTIHLTGIIRDAFGRIPPAFPLTVRVRRPDRREEAERLIRLAPGGQGVFHLDYPTNADGQLGAYDFTVNLPGSKDSLGDTTVLVEHFLPVRMELKAEPTAPVYAPGVAPVVEVAARYLFDKPAADVPVNLDGYYRLTPYKSKRHPGFAFGNQHDRRELPITPVNGRLDAEGRFRIELRPPQPPAATIPTMQAGPTSLTTPTSETPSTTASTSSAEPSPPIAGVWEAHTTVTVTEPGSRSVSQSNQFVVDTSGQHIGVRLKQGQVVAAGSDVELDWIHVSGTDELVTAPFSYRLDRVDRDSNLQLIEGRYVWKSVERLTPVNPPAEVPGSREQPRGSLVVRCPGAGQYRLVFAHDQGEPASREAPTVQEFYAVADESEAELLVWNRPERLQLLLDQARYHCGDPFRVLVRSPFSGTMLLTIETDDVIYTESRTLSANDTAFDLTVPDNLRGGAFLTASVVRAIDPARDRWIPHRAMGVVRLPIDHAEDRLPLVIEAPALARPGRAVSIAAVSSPPLDPSRPGIIHFWAVDEGVLLTTDYQTPDPMQHFFASRGAWVETADIFSLLLPDHRRPAGMDRIGGDAEGTARDIRRGSVALQSRAPAIVWRTAEPVDSTGRFDTSITLPQMTGRLRLMAVAVDHDRYAAAEQPLIVSAPLLVEAGWPRFAAPGDTFRVPVKLFNGTDQSLSVNLAYEVDGPIERRETNVDLTDIPLPPAATTTLWLTLAGTTPGVCGAKIIAESPASPSERSTAEDAGDQPETLHAQAETTLTVRPITAWFEENRFLTLSAGQEVELAFPPDCLPGTGKTLITVGPHPTVNLLPALLSVVDYPYGCAEQTASRLLVLLRAPDLLAAELPGDFRIQQAQEMIEAGLTRLWSMQTRSGGIGFWPGDRYPNRWASIYAGTTLAEMRRQGRELEQRFAEPLLAYLKGALNADECTFAERAQLCFVLAAWDQPAEGWMARLAERVDQLDMEGRAYLARAWQAVGRNDRALAVLPDDTLALTVHRTTGGRLTSQVRQEAVLLEALLDVAPDHAWIPELVRRLTAVTRDPAQASTLDNASLLSALARYQAERANADTAPPSYEGALRQAENVLLTFDHERTATCRTKDWSKPVKLSSAGSGQIFITATHRGLRLESGETDREAGLEVRRKWRTAAGAEIDPAKASFRVGDLVLVELTIRAPNLAMGEKIRNIVIIDALPAAFEVENTRLATSAQLPFGTKMATAQPDRVEFLDDRVLLFAEAGRDQATYCYAMRATTAGDFAVPPVQAMCMYDPALMSLHGGGGRIQVEP